jgi:hypothetical protein
MGNSKQTRIDPISPTSFGSLDKDTSSSKVESQLAPILQTTKLVVTIDANHELIEAIKDYSYWRGMTQKEVIMHILETFFRENHPNPRPQEVRERAEQRRKNDKRHKSL